jgi:hypothetical protein
MEQKKVKLEDLDPGYVSSEDEDFVPDPDDIPAIQVSKKLRTKYKVCSKF